MPEITLADEFGRAIDTTMRACGYRSAIEIGSWDGTGSTAILASALAKQENPRLVCIESDQSRFDQLAARYGARSWVECYHASSISLTSLTPQTWEDVWKSPHNRLQYSETQVRGWWLETQQYLAGVSIGYLESHQDDRYDVALIDGGEFCGWDEYRLLRDRVRCFMLDDVFSAYKCSEVHHSLRWMPEWVCVWSSAYVRNGAAIWVRP